MKNYFYILIVITVLFNYQCSQISNKPSPPSHVPVYLVDQRTTSFHDTITLSNMLFDFERSKDSIIIRIRDNFKTLNTVTEWDSIVTKEIWTSNEGGKAEYFFQNGTIQKLYIREAGETGQTQTEFYFFQNEISFIYEKYFEYNRPFYWDSTTMIENTDNQVFDFSKSEIYQTRIYFYNNQIFKYVDDHDCGAPMAKEYLSHETLVYKKKISLLLELISNDSH